MRMFIFLIILALACTPSIEMDTMDDIKQPPNSSRSKFLALGDSYTIGESVEADYRWPNILRDSLTRLGKDYEDPVIVAKTGWRTDELLDRATRTVTDSDYELVSLLIGVNNQYQGGPTSVYAEEFETLLKFAIDRAGGDKNKVVVLSIPDYGCTPFGSSRAEEIGKEIDEFNAINREITESHQVLYVDITPISREAKDDASLVASDNLHPSGEQYVKWVKELLKEEEFLLNLAN